MAATHEISGEPAERVRALRLFDPAPGERRCVLENRTGVRIGICFRTGGQCMVLPPFGSRRVRSDELQALRLEEWRCRGLVRVREVPRENAHRWILSLVSLGVWSIPVAGIAVLVRPDLLRAPALWMGEALLWGVIVVAGVLAWVRESRRVRGGDAQEQVVGNDFREQVFGAVTRWVGMAGVLCIGVGVPVGLLWAQRAVLVSKGIHISALCQLFLGTFATFVAMVSTLPALLFFLFQQHRQQAARTTFFREVMRIDRSLQTVTDAEAIYGLAVDEAHGEARQGLVFNLSLVPVLISTLLITFGWTAVLLPTLNENMETAANFENMALATLLKPRQTEFTFAFLGAYFFTLGMVFRRYVRADLGPKAYSHVSMRIIAAVVLAWVAAAIPTLGGPGAAEPAAMMLVFAFFVGIVPETGMAVIHDALRGKWSPLRTIIPSMEEKDPLSRLEGITLYDRARLLEEGIENVENLAHHDLIELMLRTRIPTPRVVDLVDQAILYLHVRSAVDEDPEAALQTLRRVGVRTATDLVQVEEATPPELREALYGTLGREGTLPRLRMICLAIADDEWMAQLRHWRDTRTRCNRVMGLEDLLAEMEPGAHTHAPVPETVQAPAIAQGGIGNPGSTDGGSAAREEPAPAAA